MPTYHEQFMEALRRQRQELGECSTGSAGNCLMMAPPPPPAHPPQRPVEYRPSFPSAPTFVVPQYEAPVPKSRKRKKKKGKGKAEQKKQNRADKAMKKYIAKARKSEGRAAKKARKKAKEERRKAKEEAMKPREEDVAWVREDGTKEYKHRTWFKRNQIESNSLDKKKELFSKPPPRPLVDASQEAKDQAKAAIPVKRRTIPPSVYGNNEKENMRLSGAMGGYWGEEVTWTRPDGRQESKSRAWFRDNGLEPDDDDLGGPYGYDSADDSDYGYGGGRFGLDFMADYDLFF